MSPTTEKIVLIDPFGTLGTEIASRGRRFADFDVFPSARDQLDRLRARARLGVFSLDPEVPQKQLLRQLASKGLVPAIDPELVVVAQRDDPSPFEHLLSAAALNPDRVVFVALDAGQRKRAHDAGLRVAPHLALVAPLLAGNPLVYVRISVRRTQDAAEAEDPDWAALLTNLAAVPVLKTRDPQPSLYAIASSVALRALLRDSSVRETFEIEVLGEPGLPGTTTLYLLQVPREHARDDDDLYHFVTTLAVRDDLPMVHETAEGWIFALPGDSSLEDVHPPPEGADHGHTRILLPSLSVLERPRRDRVDLRTRPLRGDECEVLGHIDADFIRRAKESLSSRMRSAGEVR
jgi:hypothetical protein